MEELFEIGTTSVSRFLANWYGPPDRDRTAPERTDLPPALNAWYEATSAYSRPLTSQNVVLGPQEVVRDGDKLIFWLENQHVYEWATETVSDNPPVYERATGVGEPWHPTGVRLTEFLVTVAVFEAVMTHEHSVCGGHLAADQLAAAVAPLRPLPVPGPMFQGQLYASTETHRGQHVIGFASPPAADARDSWWVWIAAQDPSRLAYLQSIGDFVEFRRLRHDHRRT